MKRPQSQRNILSQNNRISNVNRSTTSTTHATRSVAHAKVTRSLKPESPAPPKRYRSQAQAQPRSPSNEDDDLNTGNQPKRRPPLTSHSSTASASLSPPPPIPTATKSPAMTPVSSTPCSSKSPAITTTTCSPSPGVINSNRNVASPPRMPRVALRSFHSQHHIEFYKPIPIGQSRTTQFEIINESYDHKNVRIKLLHPSTAASIAVHPAVIDLRRGECGIIAVSCAPSQASHIEEVIGVEWDLHCTQVHVHAVAFEKSLRSNLQQMRLQTKTKTKAKTRGHRKRSLLSMRKEESEVCSTRSTSNSVSIECSIQNSGKLQQKIFSRRAVLSPTIRREKAFTAAPFSSPAPQRLKTKKNFQFSHANNEADEEQKSWQSLATVNEQQQMQQQQQCLTPKDFKKRKIMQSKPSANEQETQKRFEKLCRSVEPLQALFRCYLARKQTKRLLRDRYLLDVIKLQRITKRVRCKYIAYREACVVLQASFRGYTMRTQFNAYMHALELRRQQDDKQQREQQLVQFMDCMLTCAHTRRQFLMARSSCITIQTVFRTYITRKQYAHELQRNRNLVQIQSFVRGFVWRLQYLQFSRQHKLEQKRQTQLQKQDCMEMLLAFYRLHKFRLFLQQRKMYLLRRNGAAWCIQVWFRSAQQQRTYLHHKQMQNTQFVRGVTHLQALIRGKLTRMRFAQNAPQLQSLVVRVQNAHQNWKRENTVNYSLQSALHKLSESRTLYGVSEACDTLQDLLRVVPNLSDRIVEHNVVGGLYNVLRNSNRSVPHLTLVNKILDFLLFFGQHDRKCFVAVFHRSDTLDILSERLQIHRLDFVLFEKTTKLLSIGVGANVPLTQNTFLLNLRNSDVHRQIRTVHNIMCTKLEIAKRVNKPLRRETNANEKHKVKFEHQRVLMKCVENMNALVEKL